MFKTLGSEYLQIHPHKKVKSNAHLEQEVEKVIAKKGEGMILRDPKGKYEYK